MMKILYIAGYGRSGSSILSRLLGASEKVLSLGEFGRFSKFVGLNSLCSCGQMLGSCSVWSPVVKHGAISPLEAIRQVAIHGDYAILIDSSKTAYYDFWRPLYYILKGEDVRVLHLVRSPENVLGSAMKGRNKDIEKGISRKRVLEPVRTLVGWIFANFFASLYVLRINRNSYLRIKYEDFLENPVESLGQIEKLVCHDFSFSANIVSENMPIPSGHEIAGNRALRNQELFFRKKEASESKIGRRGFFWRVFKFILRPIS